MGINRSRDMARLTAAEQLSRDLDMRPLEADPWSDYENLEPDMRVALYLARQSEPELEELLIINKLEALLSLERTGLAPDTPQAIDALKLRQRMRDSVMLLCTTKADKLQLAMRICNVEAHYDAVVEQRVHSHADPCLEHGERIEADLLRVSSQLNEGTPNVTVRMDSDEWRGSLLHGETALSLKQRVLRAKRLLPEEIDELLYGGERIWVVDDEVLSELGIQDGATFSLVVSAEKGADFRDQMKPVMYRVEEQLNALRWGRDRWGKDEIMTDIGTWGTHSNAVGTALLNGEVGTLEQEQAVHRSFANMIQQRKAKHQDSFGFRTFPGAQALSEEQCEALMRYSDARHKEGIQDLKLELSVQELAELVGENTVEALCLMFGHEVSEVKIRRVQPSDLCINFHLDHAVHTLQVPLNSQDQYEGGRLVYVTEGGLVWPERGAGSVTIHDNTVVHGVSRHSGGRRYGLFLLSHSS